MKEFGVSSWTERPLRPRKGHQEPSLWTVSCFTPGTAPSVTGGPLRSLSVCCFSSLGTRDHSPWIKERLACGVSAALLEFAPALSAVPQRNPIPLLWGTPASRYINPLLNLSATEADTHRMKCFNWVVWTIGDFRCDEHSADTPFLPSHLQTQWVGWHLRH